MENLVINIGNPRRVELTVLSANDVKVELSRCTDVQLILWINGRSKRALSTQISNDVLIADLSASELSYLGEYSGQVKYTDSGVQQTTERVYLFRVANEFFKSTSGTGVSDTGSLVVSVSTPAAINKGYSAYELAVQNGYVGTEKEWIESLSKDSKDAASVALQSAKNADDKAKEAELAASNANNATVSVTAAKEAAVQAAVSANSAANSANTAKDSANTAAANANDKANLANTAANNADVAKANAEKATADANTATLNASNAATNANDKAAYAKEQGDYAKQQGLNAVSTAGEAATNADNAAFAASQQAAYAKQQGDYAKQEAQGIDAKIATKANQSDLVQLEQDVNILSSSNLKKVAEFTFPDDRLIIDVESVDFVNKTVTLSAPHGITSTTGNSSICFFILKSSNDASTYAQDKEFIKATNSLNIIANPSSIIDDRTLRFNNITSNTNNNFDAKAYQMVISTENIYERSLNLTESCNEFKVIIYLSKYTGGLGVPDSSRPDLNRTFGNSVTEYTYINNSLYSNRLILMAHYARCPEFNGTSNSKDVSLIRTSYDRAIANKNPITRFKFYNYTLPYVAGDKIEVYKIS